MSDPIDALRGKLNGIPGDSCRGSGDGVNYPDWTVQGSFYTVNCEDCEAWWVVDTNAMTFSVPDHKPSRGSSE